MSDSDSIFNPEQLFKFPGPPLSEDRLFATQEDWSNNACLNWCNEGWSLYASGYKNAADILVRRIEESSAGQDSLVYPVPFLYRQYLELELKDLIRISRRLQDIEGGFPQHHRIDDLWSVCHQLLSAISPQESVHELKEIGRLIREFSQTDPTSMAFRYPVGKDGRPLLPGITHINLRNVREVIEKISFILTGASAQIGEYLQYKQEIERDYKSEMEREFRGEY